MKGKEEGGRYGTGREGNAIDHMELKLSVQRKEIFISLFTF